MVEIKERIASGNRYLLAVNSIMKARYISKEAEIRVYKTIIKLNAVHGSETWTLNALLPSYKPGKGKYSGQFMALFVTEESVNSTSFSNLHAYKLEYPVKFISS